MFVSGKGVHTGGACAGEPTECAGQPCTETLGQPWCLTKSQLDHYENDLRQNDVVGNRALQLLEAHQNDLFFALVLFRDPDVTGHYQGENSERYSQAMIKADQWLGQLLAKLEELGIDHRTLVYVATDHGFDEGLSTHLNAPYGIFASNDPLIIRGGDRMDVGATLLDAYGISLGAIGGAPAVDGHSLYSVPPFPCVQEGEAYLDYTGAPACCSGLTLIGLDKRSGPNCIAPTGGVGDSSGYCTVCGNGVCDEPETFCNCPADCQPPGG
jgi:hypothetical protein